MVGVCASGKTTLASALRQFGIDAVDVAQEHSDVPHMWQTVTRPDALIFLEASDETVEARQRARGTVQFLADQRRRLAHARAHAHLVLNVDAISPEEVLARTLARLEELHDATG